MSENKSEKSLWVVGPDTYVAKHPSDLWLLITRTYGMMIEEMAEELGFVKSKRKGVDYEKKHDSAAFQLPNDDVVTINVTDGQNGLKIPKLARHSTKGDQRYWSATAAQWAAANKPGLLCSTEW